MQNQDNNLHNLTDAAIHDLQDAFQECENPAVGGLILSVMVKIRAIHERISGQDTGNFDTDPEEYCCAI